MAIERLPYGLGGSGLRKFMRAVGIMCVGYVGRSRGLVFQTGLPYRQESEGLKTPGY